MPGLLARLIGRDEAPPPRREPRLAPETRAAPGSWYADGWGASALGGAGAYASRSPVATHMAESLSAVLGCVEIISNALASLPASLAVDTDEGRKPAPDTLPAWRILQRPNAWQSWPAFIRDLSASVLLNGNAIAQMRSDGRGAAAALVPVPWQWLSPLVVSGGAGPRLVYDTMRAVPEAELLDLPLRLLDSDVLHVRARGDGSGVIGRSVLSRAAGVVHEGLELGRAAAALFANGMRPSGYIQAPQVLTKAQQDEAKAKLEEFQGATNVGRVPLLAAGWKYQQLTIPPGDAQLLQTRELNVADVCRLYSVPLPLLQGGAGAIGDLGPHIVALAQLALAPLVSVIEQEFDSAVLPSGVHLTLDMAGLLRGSWSAVVAGTCALVQTGVFSPNDGRRTLGLPAVDGGDALRGGTATQPAPAGQAPNWPGDFKGGDHLGPSPGPTGDSVALPSHANAGAA